MARAIRIALKTVRPAARIVGCWRADGASDTLRATATDASEECRIIDDGPSTAMELAW